MDKFRLKLFFWELLKLSYNDLKPGWGNPCSGLLEKLIMRQEPFLDRIMGDYSDESHEMRLNDAGLKMHWRVVRDAHGDQFKCHISGDQANEYPLFVIQATQLIKKYGFNKRR